MKPRELLILQPAASKPEELEELKENRPFVMRGTISSDARFVQLLTIPTIVDMVGFSSGGGPPGFAYLINPELSERTHALWFVVGPNLPFAMPDKQMEDLEGSFLGVIQTLGMLLGAVEVRGSEEAISDLSGMFLSAGSMVFDMVPYTVPDMVKKRFFPNVKAQKPAI